MPMPTHRTLLASFCFAVILLAGTWVYGQEQIVDPDFKPVVEKPAYPKNGPTIAIDEAHTNFHTAGGEYKPFADLLTIDGYRVVPSTRKFETGSFAGIKVLVIANARNLEALIAGDRFAPTFSEHECDVVRDWVRDGGSLLLIADHAPYGDAADNLAKRFGVTMGKGWAFDYTTEPGITTQLVFSRENGLLGTHTILAGRNASEAVKSVKTFTGQSLSVPPGATILLKLSPTAREAPTPNDLDVEGLASVDTSRKGLGSHSSSNAGRAQGIAMTFGKGRVVVLGEAAQFSAQLARSTVGNEKRDTKFGMNVPGYDDRQFALNTLHWLSGLLK